MGKNNYFEHEISVKYSDGILAQEKEWTWLAEYIELNFDLDDISSWEDFEQRNYLLDDVLSLFIRIVAIPECSINITNTILKEQYCLAGYFVGKVSFKEICNIVKSNYSKILLLILWITKLENDANNTDYIISRGIYHYKNYWQLIDCSLIISAKEELKAYAKTIDVVGFEKIKSILYDNFEQIYYETDSEFIKKYKNNLVNCNAFSHQLIKHDIIPWQESYILDMLKVSVDKREIVPLSQFNGLSNPNCQSWTKSIIDKLKHYFNYNSSIAFVLETISYILYRETPSKDIILLHCNLLTKAINKEVKKRNLFCSSFKIISYLFQDNLMKDLNSEEDFKELMIAIHKIKEPEIIEIFKEHFFPVSTQQKCIVSAFYKSECNKIKTINDIHDYDDYLSNKKALKYIEKDNFDCICEKFYYFIANSEEFLLISFLFYKFMIFLLSSQTYNSEIEKRNVEHQLIKVQKTWQTEFYNKILGSLHEKSFMTTYSKDDTKYINNLILRSPITFIKNNLPTSNDYICSHMENVAKYPLQAMFTKINIDETYPILEQYQEMYIKNKDDIFINLTEIIKNLQKTKGYRFLNQLTPEYFVSSLNREWQSAIEQTTVLLNVEKEIYDRISKSSPVKLIDYDYNSDIYLAHVTQLFPVLEIKIRELAILIGIFPFKEKIDEYWKYKDPSSILIEILKEAYKQTKSFESVSDILMVYNFMYNSNSLNIRNECIHGRKYLNGDSMLFAFKVTLLAIYTIMQRINVIKIVKKDNINVVVN